MNRAIILAGGVGRRLGLGFNKVFAELNGVPLLAYTLRNFERAQLVDSITICAGNPVDGTDVEDREQIAKLLDQFPCSKLQGVVSGAESRFESVERGLQAAAGSDDDICIIHDGCRPFTPAELIDRVIGAAQEHSSAVCGVRPKDSIQQIREEGFSSATLDRDSLLALHTPFAAPFWAVREARKEARKTGCWMTPGFEDSALFHALGKQVKIVESVYTNLKVTTDIDLLLAEQIASSFPEFTFA